MPPSMLKAAHQPLSLGEDLLNVLTCLPHIPRNGFQLHKDGIGVYTWTVLDLYIPIIM